MAGWFLACSAALVVFLVLLWRAVRALCTLAIIAVVAGVVIGVLYQYALLPVWARDSVDAVLSSDLALWLRGWLFQYGVKS